MFPFKLSNQRNQALLLYVSTIVGVILGFVASIVNTNALSPNNYGDVRYVQNLIQFTSWFLLLGYFQSGSRLLALTDDDLRRRELRGCMILMLTVLSIIQILIILVTCYFHTNQPTVSHLFFISLPVCFYQLLVNYLNTTAQGDNHIGRLAMARLLPALFYIPIAYYVYKNIYVSSSLMMILQWGIYSFILLSIIASTRPRFTHFKQVFSLLHQENKAYGLHLYYGSVAMVATSYIGGVTLGIFNSDNTNVAFYTLALTVTTPLSYLPAIIGATYFREFARQNRIPATVMRNTLLLTIGSCLLFILMIRPLIIWLYPPEYAIVGTYACWMAIGFSLHGIGDMLNRYLGSHGLGKPILFSSLISGAIKVCGFIVLVYYWDITGALTTNVLSSAIYCIALFSYYYKFIHQLSATASAPSQTRN